MFSDHLDLTTLNELLGTKVLGKAAGASNEVWESIDSTNARAIELASNGATEGVIVVARQQSAGRGRLGRTWVSPIDCGLYYSAILRPNLPAHRLPLMSLAAGTAVVKAIEELVGIQAQVKWVNDVVYGGRKLAGILCETTRSDTSTHPSVPQLALIVGIGINLCALPADAPSEVTAKAISIEEMAGEPINVNMLTATLSKYLEIGYQQLAGGQTPLLLQEWKALSNTLGKRVRASFGDELVEGTARDVTSDGALIIERADGTRLELRAGEVSIRNVDGSYA